MSKTSFSSDSIVFLEHEALDLWDKHNVFQMSLEKNAEKKEYRFYDGPPFATGLPHYGHILAGSIKDTVVRYAVMNGYYAPRKFGWDCHGLPIEQEVNKILQIPAKQAIEELGIINYNHECRKIVMRCEKQWRKVIRRSGRWVDMDNGYKTMDARFMESVWWVFSELWKKGLIYQGKKVVPYSYALGTVLSNFEASSNYQNLQDPSIIVEIPLKENIKGHIASLLIWTTTPWTLPCNLAVCAKADCNYVIFSTNNKKYICAEDRLADICKKHEYIVLDKIKGSELANKKYQPLFNIAETSNPNVYTILNDDFVSMDTGSGLVHMAPNFGEDDQRVCLSHNLDTQCDILDENGCFDETIDYLSGILFKDADSLIINKLKSMDLIFDHATIDHSYPCCPRSDTPLMYRAIPSWYVNVQAIKDKMIKNNQQINWVPSHIKDGRFGKWLNQAKDWAISRNRVWGTPIPIWINDKTQKIICISSKEMLEKYTKRKINDLHREHIDKLVFAVEGEEGNYRRVSEVLDCWFESGSMPWAQIGYPYHTGDLKPDDFLPADFIAEGLDQTRGWFYTLTILSSALEDKPAFKNAIVNGIVTAKDGKKMSKRLKNYTDPTDLMEVFGADAIRLYMINSGLVKAEDQKFNNNDVEQVVRKNILPWLNAIKFFETYAKAENWNNTEEKINPHHILDKWIFSKRNSLVKEINDAMKIYRLDKVVPRLLDFIDDLTNIYIRMNRARFWGTSTEGADLSAFATLYDVLMDLTICMAPFTPLLAEAFYQKLKAYRQNTPLSVHLCDYPQAKSTNIDKDLETAIDYMQRIITLGRSERNIAHIAVKTPLKEILIINRDPEVLKKINITKDLILNELNIKTAKLSTDEDQYVTLKLKLDCRILGKEFGKDFKSIFNHTQNLSQEEIIGAEKSGILKIGEYIITQDHWTIHRNANEDGIVTDGTITLKINTEIDQDCLDEGRAREIISLIQKYRKILNLNISKRIDLNIYAHLSDRNIIEKHLEYIKGETLTTNINLEDFKYSDDLHVADENISMKINDE